MQQVITQSLDNEQGKILLNKVHYNTLERRLVLSGSFNPLHDGHLEMMSVASKKYPKHKPLFELSLHNADKGGISEEAINKRIEQFTSRNMELALTNAPLFIQKAALFPDSVFLIGFDTYIRIIDTKYYNDSKEDFKKAMKDLQEFKIKFLVATRDAQTL